MTPKTIVKRRVVTKSISSDEGLRCVDILLERTIALGFMNIEVNLLQKLKNV